MGGTKKNAVDRVIAELHAEQAEIAKTIVRLEKARDAVTKKPTRAARPAKIGPGSGPEGTH